MMSSSGRNNIIRFPFTASQWQELEHQALVFKYMVSGMPVPPDLLFTIRRSLIDSSLSSNLLIHQPQHIGWKSFEMGFGRKIDPEPGRCRRTDGKKWRCSKEAYPDSKYCERHMHRGRNRSRKPVENILNANNSINPTTKTSISNKNTTHHLNSSHSFLSPVTSPSEPHFLYPHYSYSRPPGTIDLSSQELNDHYREATRDCRNSIYGHGHGTKREINDEHAIFSSEGNTNSYSSSSLSQMKHNIDAYSSDLLLSGQKIQKHDNYCACDVPLDSSERAQHRHKKVMHHFLDEWSPKDEDSWPNSEDHELSISIPNSLHDFFITQKW